MSILTRGTAARLAAAVAVLSTSVTAAPASASLQSGVPRPKPAARTIDLRALSLGCSFTPVDEINVRLDDVAVSSSHVVVAGRAPAGGGRAWALTSMGTDAMAWGTAEPAALRTDTALDGTSVVAGRSSVSTYAGTGWSRAVMPSGVTGPVRSVAALSEGRAALLLADGRVHLRGSGWTRLPALPGTTLAVASVADSAQAVTVEKLPSGQRVRVWSWSGTAWIPFAGAVVAGVPAMTSANTMWAATATGGVLAVNGPSRLAAVVHVRNGAVISGGGLAVTAPATSAEPLPDGRVVLAHTTRSASGSAVAGELSLVSGTLSVAVPGSKGEPVTAVDVAPEKGSRPLIATLRTSETAQGVVSSIATCG